MKKIFVLADSISIHYGPFLEAYLQDTFMYDRKGKDKECDDLDIGSSQVNGGDSSNVLEYLSLEPDMEYDILLFNCGLHDIKTREGVRQISEEKYEKNLKEILERVLARGKKIIWVNSTPVDDQKHNNSSKSFQRYNEFVLKYNEIAKKVMDEKKIPIIDLYSFTNSLDLPLYEDHVHFLEPVRKLHAAYIAGCIKTFEACGRI